MPGYIHGTSGGGVVFLCGRKLPKAPICEVCRRFTSTLLCDGRESGKAGTCDAKLCRECSVQRSSGAYTFDLCPKHRGQAAPAEQMGLGL